MFILLSILCIQHEIHSQGWVGNNGQLFAIDHLLNETNVKVGIGTKTPGEKLVVTGGNILVDNVSQSTTGNIFLGSSNVYSNHFRFYLENGGGDQPGRGGFITVKTDNDNAGIVFRCDKVDGTTKRMRINANGYVGINTDYPTANFHTNGSVRFENLPYGAGNYLTIDNDGYIHISQQSSPYSYNNNTTVIAQASVKENNYSLQQQLDSLKAEIDNLKSAIATLINKEKNNTYSNSATSRMPFYKVSPNPTNGVLQVAKNSPQASFNQETIISIQSINGLEVRKYTFSYNQEHQTFQLNNLANGVYLVNIIEGNRLLQSEKLVIKN